KPVTDKAWRGSYRDTQKEVQGLW
ncbi:hypothetical protein RX02_04697, partial [Escherichia coli]